MGPLLASTLHSDVVFGKSNNPVPEDPTKHSHIWSTPSFVVQRTDDNNNNNDDDDDDDDDDDGDDDDDVQEYEHDDMDSCLKGPYTTIIEKTYISLYKLSL